MSTIVVADDADQATIQAAIAALKVKHDRMPAHWEARRIAVMREIERLVDMWLVAGYEADRG